ncbi:hypothetical protein BVG19_g2016 [[Candida] boidinii]|nr:hypothetical protein BVG19_g2016 [[Candida] boidinii]OWB49383.1 hypothetical protein B5S27_g924 [[Candida] boidinii]OWB64986.1 hypothetical protein B5S30_g308 [[Candida] boidinii]OWB82871.1 hypothetical protein B5S33_g1499 [[Candida] boidinii]GMF50258.1 unnamed protein product [[Candida] boidinii]
MTDTVAVCGGGLVGTLCALGLAHRGYKVTLFDYRDDPRNVSIDRQNLRSINLAVSDRGIRAMNLIDPEMTERVLKDIIPMHGRMIHDLGGKQISQKYGLFGESINSIDRSFLNISLLNEIERYNKNHLTEKDQIEFKFNRKILGFTENKKTNKVELSYSNNKNHIKELKSFDFIIGADGAFSTIRYGLQKSIRLDIQQKYVNKCYIELYIPSGENGTFKIDPNHLHIWPRDDFMLIALPNQDGSFTSTFFSSWEFIEDLLKEEPNGVSVDDKITKLFEENFKDAIELITMDKILYSFKNHPKGALCQTECYPYNLSDKCLIIGDAAHSMVPFYGQGMNCGFEDVRVLLELLDKNHNDRLKTFNEYSQNRHEDLKAILKLAIDNYHEMSHKVNSSLFLFRKKLDGLLGRLIPNYWIPLYTMVSFRGDISYSDAIKRSHKQDKILKSVEFSLITLSIIGMVKYFNRK